MKILVLDNYDSFTYNLVHIIKQFDVELDVIRNDKISVDEVENYDKILLSPGPGIPEEAGILMDLIKRYAPTKPILGVCLGHQGIAESFGGSLLNLKRVMHGVATNTQVIEDDYLFEGLPKEFLSGRYHSWVVDSTKIPDQIRVTATDDNGNVMALKHSQYDVRGVQFHPESILTPSGELIIHNWINH